jgi:5S rRNA maturation endonuclease (ribonuclease M5)
MQIKDAKNIPLAQLVEHLGGRYAHTDNNKQHWYYSPFRPNEKTPSFKINELRNTWYDFGHAGGRGATGSGGDTIDLWCDYHGKERLSSVKDALAALSVFAGQPHIKPVTRKQPKEEKQPPRFKMLRLHQFVFYKPLIAELNRRRISEALAAQYVQQIFLQDTQRPEKKLNGFAFANDKGGYEISIPGKENSFKTCIGGKSPTTFGAKNSDKLYVFEGMWDFLSWQAMQDKHEVQHHTIVLNSVSFVGEITSQIIATKELIKTVVLFLDNDEAGKNATQYMMEQLSDEGITVRTMDTMYRGYKDFSDYWMKDSEARKITRRNEIR